MVVKRRTPNHITSVNADCVRNTIVVMTAMGQLFGGFHATQVVPTDERGEQIADSYGNVDILVVKQMRNWVAGLRMSALFPVLLETQALIWPMHLNG